MRSINRTLAFLAAGVFCGGVWADSTDAPAIHKRKYLEKKLFGEKKRENVQVRWIPQHNAILANVNGTIEVIYLDSGKEEILMEGFRVPGPDKSTLLELSNDGEKVIVEEDDSTMILNLKTREKVLIADVTMEKKVLNIGVLKEYFSPGPMKWSPDGQKIAYEIYSHGVFIMNTDGTDNNKISPPENGSLLGWSNSGDRITLLSKTSSRSDVVTINMEGKDFKILVPMAEALKWFPNGDGYCFARGGRLYLKKSDSNGIVHAGDFNTPTKYLEQGRFDMDISPDGKKIAFLYNIFEEEKAVDGLYAKQIDREIIVYDTESGTAFNITNSPQKWEWDPQWSSDSHRLMFIQGERDGDPNAMPVILDLMTPLKPTGGKK